jgi:urease accessory protein
VSIGARYALDVTFASVGGRTVMTRRRYRWPLLIGRVFPDPTRPRVGSATIQNAAGTIIPGDVVRQRIEVVDGGSAVVRGQGATLVSGIPRGDVAVEDTRVRVDASSRLLLDPSPRILTPHARYRQHTQVCVEPGGRAVLVDTVVLHPDLTDEGFGSYASSVAVTAPDGTLHALDAQMLETMPRVRRAPTAFGTVYVGWRNVAGNDRRGDCTHRGDPTKSVAREPNAANTSATFIRRNPFMTPGKCQ